MSIETAEQLRGMERAGKITRLVIEAMKTAVRPGVTTGELDEIGAAVMRRNGARSAPKLVYGFPGHNCISVNDEVVHGIPGSRRLAMGDVVKLDVTVEADGYMADACETVSVGVPKRELRRFIDCARRAFEAGVSASVPGVRACDIGKAIQTHVLSEGYSVVQSLTGHGIGRTIHEQPTIPNVYDPSCCDVITEGLVFTIEPIIAMGTSRSVLMDDGWTIRTRDCSLSAHYEHTVMATSEGARILTA